MTGYLCYTVGMTITQWSEYPPFTEYEAQQAILEILVQQEFLVSEIEDADTPKDALKVTVQDALEAFQGNCYDDQHDGGAHKEDLILVNRVYQWAGMSELQDNCESIQELPEDKDEDSEEWSEAIMAWEEKWIFSKAE